MNDKICLAITPTDLLVKSEDYVLPSLLDKFNKIYPGLDLTMDDYNYKGLKGLARQALCNKIEEVFPDRVNGRKLDVDTVYKDRDMEAMRLYMANGTTMAPNAIEALSEIKDNLSVPLLWVSNNSVQRGMAATHACTNGKGIELLNLFEGRMFESQGFQAQNPSMDSGSTLRYGIELHNFSPSNTIVLCRASGVGKFMKAGFKNIIGAVNFSKTPEKDIETLNKAGAIAIMKDLTELPDIMLNAVAAIESRNSLISRFQGALTNMQFKR